MKKEQLEKIDKVIQYEKIRIKIVLERFIKNQKKKHYSSDLILKHLIDGLKAGEIIN